MSESIIIAETGKGTVSAVTAELVSAAIALGTSPIVVVPCTDASMADNAGYDGVARTIAVKGACFENYDAASWASAIDAASPSGIIITAATPQSKDIAARIAAKRAQVDKPATPAVKPTVDKPLPPKAQAKPVPQAKPQGGQGCKT